MNDAQLDPGRPVRRRRVAAAVAVPARAPLGAVEYRYLPVALEAHRDDRWQVVVLDLEEGSLTWKSEVAPRPGVFVGDTWRAGSQVHIRMDLGEGSDGFTDYAWVTFDAATGKAVGAWDLGAEDPDEGRRQVAPSLPAPWQFDGSTVYAFHWSTTMAIDLDSGIPRVVRTEGLPFTIHDRRADAEGLLGPLP